MGTHARYGLVNPNRPKFVWVSHQIDCGDLPGSDVERDGLIQLLVPELLLFLVERCVAVRQPRRR